MSKLRFCGTCGLDFQQLSGGLARKYRRDPTRCPRCRAPTDADAYTLRRQDTAERLAAGPLIAPVVDEPTPKATPPRHPNIFIASLAASLITAIIGVAILMSLGIVKLQDDLPAPMHSVAAATSTPTETPTNTATPTLVMSGPPIVMTIQPYAITVDCNSATLSATTTLSNLGTTAFQWAASVIPQAGGAAPFQLTPLSGVLQPQTRQTLTISQIAHAGNIVITANGVGESIIVTCTAMPANTVTPVSTTPTV